MGDPIVLVPGLLCSAEVSGDQVTALWPFGSVTVASTLEGGTVGEIAASILRDAPARFALAGIPLGGYLCMEIMRQAPDRVTRLALLSTSARPDTPERSQGRRKLLAQAGAGEFGPWVEAALTSIMHPSRQQDADLRAITDEWGRPSASTASRGRPKPPSAARTLGPACRRSALTQKWSG